MIHFYFCYRQFLKLPVNMIKGSQESLNETNHRRNELKKRGLLWGLPTNIWLLFPVYSDPGSIDRDRSMASELNEIVRSGFNLRHL